MPALEASELLCHAYTQCTLPYEFRRLMTASSGAKEPIAKTWNKGALELSAGKVVVGPASLHFTIETSNRDIIVSRSIYVGHRSSRSASTKYILE